MIARLWRRRHGEAFPHSYAFQPIVDVATRTVFSYEALLRGCNGEAAGAILGHLDEAQIHALDELGRERAVELSVALGNTARLNLNFMPSAITESASALSRTFDAAARCGLPGERIVLEITETQAIRDHRRFTAMINEVRARGVSVAIDDFGAGHSGLNLLANFQPDMVKLDMELVRDISRSGPRQAIVRAIIQVCFDLGIDFIAEGVESEDELLWFQDQGTTLFQGYLFARPAFEALPPVHFPACLAAAAGY
ncbi:MAG: EAL domain-containing protein [Gammaproteobacteria bacterium]|nr:EAL domain-containing protein [Gammaproteobacteria bacterium]